MTSKETLLHLSPRGVERAGACFIAETSAAPGSCIAHKTTGMRARRMVFSV